MIYYYYYYYYYYTLLPVIYRIENSLDIKGNFLKPIDGTKYIVIL